MVYKSHRGSNPSNQFSRKYPNYSLNLKAHLSGDVRFHGNGYKPTTTPVEDLQLFSPWAYDDLRASGLTDDYINKCRTYWAEIDNRIIASGIGQPTTMDSLLRIHNAGGANSGWMRIEYRDPRRQWRSFCTRWKPRFPFLTEKGERAKYITQKGQPPRVYFPTLPPTSTHFDDTATPIIITEGEKKADAANQAGFTAISIPGVWAWTRRGKYYRRNVIADIVRLPVDGRDVHLVFDSDLRTNPKVHRALTELAEELFDRGANVKVVYLPSNFHNPTTKVGLDDYLIVHGADALRRLLDGSTIYRKHEDFSISQATRDLTAKQIREEKESRELAIAAHAHVPGAADCSCTTCARAAVYPGPCGDCIGHEYRCTTCVSKYCTKPRQGTDCPFMMAELFGNKDNSRYTNLKEFPCGRWGCWFCRANKVAEYLERIKQAFLFEPLRDGVVYYCKMSVKHVKGYLKYFGKKNVRSPYVRIVDAFEQDENGREIIHVFSMASHDYRPKKCRNNHNGEQLLLSPTALTPDDAYTLAHQLVNSIEGNNLKRRHPVRLTREWKLKGGSVRSGLMKRLGRPFDHHTTITTQIHELGGVVEYKDTRNIDDSTKYGRPCKVRRSMDFVYPALLTDKQCKELTHAILSGNGFVHPRDRNIEATTDPNLNSIHYNGYSDHSDLTGMREGIYHSSCLGC
jgi:hypothetical protein